MGRNVSFLPLRDLAASSAGTPTDCSSSYESQASTIEDDGRSGRQMIDVAGQDQRAINPGDERSLTVTRGYPAPQVRPCDWPRRHCFPS